MKTFPWRAVVFVLLAVSAPGTAVQGAPEPVDPIVGNWIWHENKMTTFRADGTVSHPHGNEGTWQYLHNPEVQRHYRIIWNHGIYVDEVVCSEDGQRAHVRDKEGKQFDVRRALDDPPAATPAPAPSRPATAQPTVADAADPIVGEWSWLKGQSATFLADGTVKSSGGGRGSWEFLHNPESERKYRVTLRTGKYTSDFLFDPATGTGRATNSEGRFYPVAPKSATAVEPTPKPSEGYFGAPGR